MRLTYWGGAFEFIKHVYNVIFEIKSDLLHSKLSKTAISWLEEALTQLNGSLNEYKKCYALVFPLEKILLEWEMHNDKIAEYVRLGDKYLKVCTLF